VKIKTPTFNFYQTEDDKCEHVHSEYLHLQKIDDNLFCNCLQDRYNNYCGQFKLINNTGDIIYAKYDTRKKIQNSLLKNDKLNDLAKDQLNHSKSINIKV